jgi:hypothetical protein
MTVRNTVSYKRTHSLHFIYIAFILLHLSPYGKVCWCCTRTSENILITTFLITLLGRRHKHTHSPFLTAGVDSGNQIEKNEMSGTCSMYVRKRGAYRILVGRPEGKRPLGRPRRRWEDNIKIDLQKVWWDIDWIELAQDRDRWRALVNAVMNFRVP